MSLFASNKKRTGTEIIDSVFESFKAQTTKLAEGIALLQEATTSKKEKVAELTGQIKTHEDKIRQGESLKTKIETFITT